MQHPAQAAPRRPTPKTGSSLHLLALLASALALGASALLTDPARAAAPTPVAPAPTPAPDPVEPPPTPEGLKGIPVPTPSTLGAYVANRDAAVRLGKALFWDMQLGSDGKVACASCHFHAGADSRSRNQVAPGLLRVNADKSPNPDRTFQVGGVNYQFKSGDFPFHKFADPANRHSAVVRTHNDIASSNGVNRTRFVSATPGAGRDNEVLAGDPVFTASGVQTRQVEPRNSPTMINAVFNFRNFWDGRATYLFNGASPFGPMDAAARVYRSGLTATSPISAVQVAIDNASLASLATGPALSDFEMSAAGRSWPEIGRRLLAARPLAQQAVSPSDSVLWFSRAPSGPGLTGTYDSMVKAAFRPEWWISTNKVTVNGVQYSQAEANFSLFFGLAIQLYGATLVSDDSPFDRFMAGNTSAMNPDAAAGMGLFFGKGQCASCHGGAEFTNASVRKILKAGPLARMVMGNGQLAVYDEGFYNVSITKTLEDIANGGKNGVGRPLATSQLAKEVSSAEFQRLIGVPPNLSVGANERIAVNGAFKVPTIRNAELTAPYFHNGDSLTLEQVMQFYNRGGNHFNNNLADVDAEIKPLGLTQTEINQLIAFIKATTDERVRYARAPFDHPQLFVSNGHAVDASGMVIADAGRARDIVLEIPAVGATGRSQPLLNFLEVPGFQLVAQHSGKCVDVNGNGTSDGTPILQWTCNGQANQKWEEVPANGGFTLRSKVSGKCLDVSGISYAQGAKMHLWNCHGGDNQIFNWVGNELKVKHSGMCLNVNGASTADGAQMIQWPCTSTATNDNFTKR